MHSNLLYITKIKKSTLINLVWWESWTFIVASKYKRIFLIFSNKMKIRTSNPEVKRPKQDTNTIEKTNRRTQEQQTNTKEKKHTTQQNKI